MKQFLLNQILTIKLFSLNVVEFDHVKFEVSLLITFIMVISL